MGKRAGCTSATAVAKRQKDDPIAIKCEEVVAAFKGAPDMPLPIRELLSAVLPLAMVPQEERHIFQESVIMAVSEEMAKVESGLQAAVAQAETQVCGVCHEKEQQVAGMAKLEAELTDKKTVAKEKKYALAKDANDVRIAKGVLAEAEEQKTAGENEIAAAALGKSELEAAIHETLLPLKEGMPIVVEQDAPAKVARLMSQLEQLVGLEQSMALVAPGALGKLPASRGAFETMVVEQLTEQSTKRLAALEAQVENAMPAKAALGAAVNSAQVALAEARVRQRASAEAFIAARSAEEEGEAALAAASKALKAMGPQQRIAEKALQGATHRLEAFRAGPSVSFSELRTPTALVSEEAQQASCASEVAQADAVISAPGVTEVA